MRILFVTAPYKSHLYVQAPLASALRNAGHDVCVAGPPEMADKIAQAGLTGISIGETLDLSATIAAAVASVPVTPIEQRDRLRGQSVQDDYVREYPHEEIKSCTEGWRQVHTPDSAFEDIVSFARDWRPDLVISDPIMFTGAVAARASGAAYARALFGVDALAQLRSACAARPDGSSDPIRDWLEPILDKVGCAFDEEVVTGQWTIYPIPRWIWRPSGPHYVPVRPVPFNGPSTIPRWLYKPPARKLFEAVADLDIEVVATFDAKQLESVSEIPDNVRVVDFVPLNTLLATCSAIIHCGGAGTFASALENAVPQLIAPNVFFAEKWWGPVAMANGLEARGAGIYAGDADQLTADSVRADLRRVLEEPSYAQNATRLRAELLGMPSPNDLVPALEKLTAAHRGAFPTARVSRRSSHEPPPARKIGA
jgi:UDP-glucoronosyl and UDP-glucosyl transferase